MNKTLDAKHTYVVYGMNRIHDSVTNLRRRGHYALYAVSGQTVFVVNLKQLSEDNVNHILGSDVCHHK
jgi:hypothetical protein